MDTGFLKLNNAGSAPMTSLPCPPFAEFRKMLIDAVRTREDAYPTGLAMPAANIAIPHTDPGFVSKPYIAVVKPAVPVTFNAMAGMGAPVPAQIIINLGIAEPGGQVEALQALMNIFMDTDAAADVLGQTTPQGMVDAIRRHF